MATKKRNPLGIPTFKKEWFYKIKFGDGSPTCSLRIFNFLKTVSNSISKVVQKVDKMKKLPNQNYDNQNDKNQTNQCHFAELGSNVHLKLSRDVISIELSSLHWPILGFFYALFVPWSILPTIEKNLTFKC